MTNDSLKYLHAQLSESQTKYAYFLLAAAGSGIGLAVKVTEHASLNLVQSPLAIAVGAWGLSFYFGCQRIAWHQATISANYELIQIRDGVHPDVPAQPDYIQAAAEGTQQAARGNAARTNRNAKRQFRFLMFGVTSFVAWHLLEMASRTPALTAQYPFLIR